MPARHRLVVLPFSAVSSDIRCGYFSAYRTPPGAAKVAREALQLGFQGLKLKGNLEMDTPGIVQFQGEMTPIQAIFDRGGFTNEAQVDSVILIRNAGGSEPIIGRINVNQGLEDGTPEKITLLSQLHESILKILLGAQQITMITDITGYRPGSCIQPAPISQARAIVLGQCNHAGPGTKLTPDRSPHPRLGPVINRFHGCAALPGDSKKGKGKDAEGSQQF